MAQEDFLYRRGMEMRSRVIVGLVAVLLIVIGVYLAFAKSIPFTGRGYEISAVFENPSTVKPDSPVRIAGVNVGKVTEVESEGEMARVTFQLDDEARPIHSDAAVQVRPRLFLEGNFFLDLNPGSPSAPELPSGSTLKETQTSVAVQLDQVLTALQAPERKNLQDLLQGFGTALTHEPTAAEDADQDPDVQGETAAESLNDTFDYGGEAGRTSAIVNEALLGTEPHDLSDLIAADSKVFGALLSREEQLKDLITNFNVTVGALADEQGNLSETIRLLAPTLETAQPALAHLNDAFPQLRAFAIEARPGVAELPDTIAAAEPWLDQAGPLLSGRELGGLASLLERATPNLALATQQTTGFLNQLELTSRCASGILIPTGNIVIDNAGGAYPFTTGVANYKEFFYSAAQQAGESQGFDGNGSYVRFQVGGGPVRVSAAQPGGGFQNDAVYGNTIEPPLGTRPAMGPKPPYNTDVPCYQNPLPDINGAAPVGPPSPSAP
ncbi:MAG TPA: MlaD family protein [Solirubrobacterales bacterium]|nr:MlaD family protein [Solirubrobacterales bacterium]